MFDIRLSQDYLAGSWFGAASSFGFSDRSGSQVCRLCAFRLKLLFVAWNRAGRGMKRLKNPQLNSDFPMTFHPTITRRSPFWPKRY